MSARKIMIEAWALRQGVSHGIAAVEVDALLGIVDIAGYAVVPKEPTKAMKVAACQTKSDGETQSYVLEYRAMLTAAKETT